MAIPPGTKFGSYEIQVSIGAGGMGEVYKATDTRLGRLVAIKVLLAQFASQGDFKDRFEREAQTIAGLTHPHVCTLYDVGQHDGMDYLVMEYLEGETLAARLTRGPLPLDEALRVAIQIADALDKAHTLGVTHRDLKPANIMLMKSGAKLMDFGLAKRRAPVEGGSASILPTGVADLTQHGSIIGTVQYMAPEQVEGEEADPRTDIFAFGMVLYEMITGKKAFTGKSQASLMASILNGQPEPMSSIQAQAPPALQRVVEICLAKDPRDRWQTAHDVMLQLRWIAEGGSSVGLPQPIAHRRKQREWLAWGLAALGLAAAAALAVPYIRKAPADVRVMRFGILPNAGTAFGPENANIRPFPAISPDGKRIVFQAQEGNEPVMLWVRSLDAMDAQKLQGTENASIPFWSPDSRSIAFTADNKLKRIDASGGPVQVLSDITTNNTVAEGTWGPGTILYSHGAGVTQSENEGILQIPDTGGKPVVILAPNKDRKETILRAPYFLPDGKHFLYLAQDPNIIWVGSTDPKEAPIRLLAADSRAVYAKEGYLLFAQQGNLMAQKFDAASLTLSGTAFPVAEDLRVNLNNGRAAFAVSDNGTLVYRVGSVRGGEGLQIALFDREGKITPLIKQPGDNRNPRLSPDGKYLAMDRRPTAASCTNCIDIWTLDLMRGTNTRITFGKGDTRLGGWSSDGTRLFYAANPEGSYAIFSKLSSGVGNEELLFKSDLTINFVTDVSKDYLFFNVEDPKTGGDIWYVPLTGTDRTPKAFINTPFNQSNAHLSSDGRWVAYQSNESGQNEIFVQPFPATGQRIPISVDTGVQPRWRADGKELIYATIRRVFMRSDVRVTGSMLEASKPERMFVLADGANNNYFLTRDGQRFLIASTPDALTSGFAADSLPLTVITNWTAAFKQ